MPVNYEEERRKRQANGGIWEAARGEFANMFKGSEEGRQIYEQGRDAITGGIRRGSQAAFAGSPEGRAVYEQGRDAIMRGPQISPEFGSAEQVGRGVRAAKDWLRSIPEKIEAGAQARKVEGMGPVARQRYLEMAGYPSEATRRPAMPQAAEEEAPVMSKSQQGEPQRSELGLRGEGSPQDAARGGVRLEQPLSEKSGQRVAAAVSTRSSMPSGAATSVSSDPRTRYMEMAKMSLEDREKYLNSLPTGQRPIQVLRGNQESWYSPGMSREFATIPEAMSGVQGRPTYESEEERADKAAGRGAMAGRQAALFAHQERMQESDFKNQKELMDKYGSLKIPGTGKGKGGVGGAAGEEWKFDKTPTEEGGEAGVIVEKHSGMVLPVKISEAQNIAAIYRNVPRNQWGSAGGFLAGFPRETRNEVFKYLPPEMKDFLIDHFENAAKGKQKKEE